MIKPYYDTARREVDSNQGIAEACYWAARSALSRRDLRGAVGHQQAARIASAAARAAYRAWVGSGDTR